MVSTGSTSGVTGTSPTQGMSFGQALKQSWANTFATSKALGVLRVLANITVVGALVDLGISAIAHKLGTLGVNAQPTESRGIGRSQQTSSSSRVESTPSERGKVMAEEVERRILENMREASEMLDPRQHLETNIQTMCDDTEGQKFLLANLDNTAFSGENFVGIEDGPKDGEFTAKFKGGDLVLSDRNATRGELRGQALREKLTDGRFTSMRDLISQTHLDKDDTILLYMATPGNGIFQESFEKDPEGTKIGMALLKDKQIPGTRTTYGELLRFDRAIEKWESRLTE